MARYRPNRPPQNADSSMSKSAEGKENADTHTEKGYVWMSRAPSSETIRFSASPLRDSQCSPKCSIVADDSDDEEEPGPSEPTTYVSRGNKSALRLSESASMSDRDDDDTISPAYSKNNLSAWTDVKDHAIAWLDKKQTNWFYGPGWNKSDRRPEFLLNDDDRGALWMTCRNGKEIIGLRKRKKYKVGIAYNTFRFAKKLVDHRGHTTVSHWGFYVTEEGKAGQLNTKVYSMNWDSHKRQNLVLDIIWFSLKRGWQRELYDAEVEKLEEFGGYTMYLCPEEIELVAQAVLKLFISKPTKNEDCKAMKAGSTTSLAHQLLDAQRHTKKYTGHVYNTLAFNCQDYAEYLLNTLIEQGWDDRRRLQQPWDAEAWLTNPFHAVDIPGSKKSVRTLTAVHTTSLYLVRKTAPFALLAGAALAVFAAVEMLSDDAIEKKAAKKKTGSDGKARYGGK